MKASRILVSCLLLLVSLALLAGGERKLEVAVGASISTAKMTSKHTITIAALEEGKTTYQITHNEHTHEITLSKTQIADILSGTTVNLDVAQDLKARITVKTSKPKSSGW